MAKAIDLERLREESAGPGKFEGEGPETLYFHERSMDGDGEILTVMEEGCGEWAALFDVNDEERAAFETSEPYFLLTEDEQGFCSGLFVSAARADELRAEVEELAREEE